VVPSTQDVTITLYYSARTMTTFGPPVDAQPIVNVAQAGRSIPFKFNVTDSTGAPVSTLTASDVTLTANLGPCDGSAPTDALESYVTGSGLQNLGGGAYQYVFQTPKAWAGSCGDLTVSVGAGGSQTATFKFRS
jgi:hypothetical protein